MKDTHWWGIRWEDLRALTLRGVKRLTTLASMVLLFLMEVGWAGKLASAVVGAVASFSYKAADVRYRLLRGAGALLSKTPTWMVRGWARAVL